MKTYNANLVKQHQVYSVQQVADLFGIHKRTVLNWTKDGLCTVDESRPYLIGGKVLKTFLDEKNSDKKKPCKDNELYCFGCCEPRTPKNKCAEYYFGHGESRLLAECGDCGVSMNRSVTLDQLAVIEKLLSIERIPFKPRNIK